MGEQIVPTRTGTTKLACGAADPKRRAWCILPPGHPGKHQDSWGKKFVGAEPAGRLSDLPRYLAASGSKGLADIVSEELTKFANARRSLAAVAHQMLHGEASDVFDLGVVNEDTQRDLRWCREQIEQVLKTLS
jgi:hypothetical protein